MKQNKLPPWEREGYKVVDNYDDTLPDEGDRLLLQHMVDNGADLTKERHIIHYLYFPDSETRELAVQLLQKANYQTRYGADYGETQLKSLIAERHGLINTEVVNKEREFINEIAEANDGEYNGWEASLD